MFRNLISEFGRSRSLLTNSVDASPPPVVELLHTAGGNFDPSCVRSGGNPPNWDFGDSNTDTGDSVTNIYAGAGDYTVTWDIDDSALTELSVYNDEVTSIVTKSEWTNLSFLACHVNSNLATLNTFNTWTSLRVFYCSSNNLTSLDTFSTWAALENFHCEYNSITSLDTFSTWTALNSFHCLDNNLTSLDAFSTWTSINVFYCHTNSLPAGEIDDIIINLDATGVSNGDLRYQNNPGSADGLRSGPAATAKSNLIAKGWAITI